MAQEIAALIKEKAAAGKTCVLGLATGSTPIKLYQELVRLHKEEGLSFKNVVTFNLDEYFPIEQDAPQSYWSFMHHHLFNHIDIDPENIHIPSGKWPKEEPKAEWLLIDESPVDYENDDTENEILSKEPKQSLLSKMYNFVSTGSAFPNSKSEQDKNIDGIKFITRYVYAGETSVKSRQFCQRMMSAGKIYRKEDIIRMREQIVNEGWGPKGADTYDIWLYKGGGNCHHRWNKQVYASFEGVGIDVNSPNARQIAGKKAEEFGYVIKNPKLVSTRPVDMPYNGFLPTNKRFK